MRQCSHGAMMSDGFPCTRCGACCRRYAELVPGHIREHGARADGSCSQLGEDWACAVFSDRPWYCRVDVVGGGYAATARRCNEWIASDGIGDFVQLGRRDRSEKCG